MDAISDIGAGTRAAIVGLQAIVAAYVASVVGVAFVLGPYALTPTGLFAALVFGLPYTFLPGVAGLIAAYFWMRRMRSRTWLRAACCVLWGALVGFLWVAFFLATGRERHYFSLGTLAGVSYFFRMNAGVLLMHIVPGAVGGLVFWLLTRRRIEAYT
jgi:hypothetical protein